MAGKKEEEKEGDKIGRNMKQVEREITKVGVCVCVGGVGGRG